MHISPASYHEWPVRDRRRHRESELVVRAEPVSLQSSSDSMVFQDGSRPWRVLPLSAIATVAILVAVSGASSAFSAIQDGAEVSLVPQALAQGTVTRSR